MDETILRGPFQPKPVHDPLHPECSPHPSLISTSAQNLCKPDPAMPNQAHGRESHPKKPGQNKLTTIHTELLGKSSESFMLSGNIYLLLLPHKPLATLALLTKRFPTPGRN